MCLLRVRRTGRRPKPRRRRSARRPRAASSGQLIRTAIFSTYPPRACGIGSFAFDLREALLDAPGLSDVRVVSVIAEPMSTHNPELLVTVPQEVRGDYVRAARLLSRLAIDVVLLQHEYGIFGGPDGEYVLSFATELAQPLVVTLHTVLSKPSPQQLSVLSQLCDEAELVIVMTDTARRLLIEARACAPEKIRVIPHGAPNLLTELHAFDRQPLYVPPQPAGNNGAGRFLLSTFGLISPGKGLEAVVDALPVVVERHPEVLYVIAGQTHPTIARREGERYRLELERRVVDLDLVDHVEFDDRFLSIGELGDLLAATDVFITPYRSREQISSGALTFAVAAGCAVISTPYWYATDMLSSGAGRLVPFGDSEAIGREICRFVEEPHLLLEARDEAQRIGSGLAWSSVAEQTAAVLTEATMIAPRRTPMPAREMRLTGVRTEHLRTLIDDVGIMQHARGVIPAREHGYCVDDVSRLALVAHELARRGDENWTTIFYRALAFLTDAAHEGGGGMRNFMSYERRWLDSPHLGDHVGRSLWALGEILATAWLPAVVSPMRELVASLVDSLRGEVSLHTAAYAALGLARLDPDRLDPGASQLLDRFVDQLGSAYESNVSPGWPWFEDRLRYDNASFSHAMILAGRATGREDCIAIGLESLRWLGDESGLGEGTLRLPGHLGRGRGEPAPGDGDEQPIDACALVEAELAAFTVTGDRDHGARAQTSFNWFLGRNRLGVPLYDFATGGCSDGLGETAANRNEGAESTLAFHRAKLVLDAAQLPIVARRPAMAAT
jgi:glycosyltransferase involved in cell wall biosynthesis